MNGLAQSASDVPAHGAGEITLQRGRARKQARIRGRPIQHWTFSDGTVWASFHRAGDGYLVRFPGVADFIVAAAGDAVECRPVPGTADATVEHAYLNQVVPLALSRTGRLVFHASAVDLEGRGVAFMGASGRGKSTLAAAFASDGAPFMTDDGLVVDEQGSEACILPSHPWLRLWEDSRMALRVHDSTAEASEAPKRRLLASEALPHAARPLALHRVYVLGEGKARSPTIESLAPGDALIELVRHSFLIDVEAEELLSAHFSGLARIARRPIFYRLDYPRRFDGLTAVRQAVATHASTPPESLSRA